MTELKTIRLFPRELKLLITVFILVLTVGVSIGLIYVGYNTDYTLSGTQTFYGGDTITSDFEIPEQYPKSFEALLLTSHTHITAFSIIFLVMGILMFFTESLPPKWKMILMIEPLVSTLVTFGSFFAIRYIHHGFVYLTMVSGILMYISYYIMAWIILKESLNK
ncbi:MAG: hypothetical protein HOB42_06150 [Candidatus Marinimicrobia bacterium]|jgi:hypothetical protein|nr:hypothetical protein [Candidatus Neomarinimicrobiota bacterium]MBT5175286.1 hypothetical protein [Candidatus Neomarinimicrobiota bacterium]MBT6637536.1 hypothetical protein [Candidatus Neomarinimicrobiota bacterium]